MNKIKIMIFFIILLLSFNVVCLYEIYGIDKTVKVGTLYNKKLINDFKEVELYFIDREKKIIKVTKSVEYFYNIKYNIRYDLIWLRTPIKKKIKDVKIIKCNTDCNRFN